MEAAPQTRQCRSCWRPAQSISWHPRAAIQFAIDLFLGANTVLTAYDSYVSGAAHRKRACPVPLPFPGSRTCSARSWNVLAAATEAAGAAIAEVLGALAAASSGHNDLLGLCRGHGDVRGCADRGGVDAGRDCGDRRKRQGGKGGGGKGHGALL